MKKQRQTQKTYTTVESKKENYQASNYYELESANSQSLPPHSTYQNLKYQNAKYKKQYLCELIRVLYLRRKRFCFQMIKQFFLFPDDTISENISLDTHDKIFFNDEPIHTIFKISQTKYLEALLWGFINLKALRLKKKLQKFSADIDFVKSKVEYRHKKDCFSQLKLYSIKIKPTAQTTVVPQKRNMIVSSKINEKITVKHGQVQKNPSVTRIASTSPQITRVALTPAKSRVIYPTQETLRRRQSRQSSYKNQVRVLRTSPSRQAISPTHYTNSSHHCCGGTCIHIHGCCTINCHSHDKKCGYQHSCCSGHGYRGNVSHKMVEDEYNIHERLSYLEKLEGSRQAKG